MTVSTYYLVTGLPNLSARQACPPFKFVCLLSWAQRFHSSDRHAFPSSARLVSPPISCADDKWKTAFRIRNCLKASCFLLQVQRQYPGSSLRTRHIDANKWLKPKSVRNQLAILLGSWTDYCTIYLYTVRLKELGYGR